MVIVGVFYSIPFYFFSFPLPSPSSTVQQIRISAQNHFVLFHCCELWSPWSKPEMIHPQPQIKSGLLKFQLPPTASRAHPLPASLPRVKIKIFWLLFFSWGRRKCSEFKIQLLFYRAALKLGGWSRQAHGQTSGKENIWARQGNGNRRARNGPAQGKNRQKNQIFSVNIPLGDVTAEKGETHGSWGLSRVSPARAPPRPRPRPRAGPGAGAQSDRGAAARR